MKQVISHVIVISIIIFLTTICHSAVPSIINYQGKLFGVDGKPVTDGAYKMQFAIYAVSTGGTALWSEPDVPVLVKNGVFSVLLGNSNNLPTNIFNGPEGYFGVKVGADPEMVPRQRISSVPFAIVAGSVSNNAITTEKIADKAVTADKLAPGILGAAIPTGAIIIWSGASDAIPAGWALCDGNNNTPDLRDRFLVGAGGGYAVGAIGGVDSVMLSTAQMPVHAHGINDPGHGHGVNDPGHSHSLNSYMGYGAGPYNDGYGKADGNSPANIWSLASINGSGTGISIQGSGSNLSIQYSGGDQPHENRPPYFALCYIMKIGN